AIARESRGGDRAVPGEIAAGEAPLHHDAERIAFFQREEIDVPLEDVDQLLRKLRRLAGAAQRLVKRGIDRRGDRRFDLALLGLARVDFEGRSVADGVDLAPAVDLHLNTVDGLLRVVVKAHEVSGTKAAYVDRFPDLACERRALAV